MNSTSKKLIFGSMAVAGVVGLMAILDLVIKVPFSGRMVMDITLIIGAALVGYMCWESYKEMT